MDQLTRLDEDAIHTTESYRRRKATSMLSVVFTDIADSTALREKLGETSYEELRERYDEQVGNIVTRGDDGAIVKGTGDGMLCVFAEPSTAVERCLELQRVGREHPLFRLRIGLDLGQVSVKAASGVVADVFGRQVNRASRIQSLAEPGHILCSYGIYDCAVGWLHGDSIAWFPHGLALLKGFKDPAAIYEPFDPTVDKAQSSGHFLRPEQSDVRYSRAAVRPTRPLPIGEDELKSALLALRSDLVRIHEPWDWESAQPIDSYSKRIVAAIERLAPWSPPQLSILWVGESLRSGGVVRSLLRASGMQVTHIPSPDDTRIYGLSPHVLFVYEVPSENALADALRFLKWQKTNPSGGPVLIYGSIGVESEHEELSLISGAALCTAGTVTLLNGIAQVIERLRSSLPFEYIDEDQGIDALLTDRSDSQTILARIWRLFGGSPNRSNGP